MSTKKHDVLRNQIDDNYAGYCNRFMNRGRRNKWSIATFFRHNTRSSFVARYLSHAITVACWNISTSSYYIIFPIPCPSLIQSLTLLCPICGISFQVSEKGGRTVGLCLANMFKISKPSLMGFFWSMYKEFLVDLRDRNMRLSSSTKIACETFLWSEASKERKTYAAL